MNITFSKNYVEVNGQKIIDLIYDILDVYKEDDVIVILIDPDSYIGKEKNFKNLIAYNTVGVKLWEVDFPQEYKPDYYWKITNKKPLVAKSLSSYDCEIDITTGKILNSNFYK